MKKKSVIVVITVVCIIAGVAATVFFLTTGCVLRPGERITEAEVVTGEEASSGGLPQEEIERILKALRGISGCRPERPGWTVTSIIPVLILKTSYGRTLDIRPYGEDGKIFYVDELDVCIEAPELKRYFKGHFDDAEDGSDTTAYGATIRKKSERKEILSAVELAYRTADENHTDTARDIAEQAVAVMRNRLELLGLRGTHVELQSEGFISVRLVQVSREDKERAKSALGRKGDLWFAFTAKPASDTSLQFPDEEIEAVRKGMADIKEKNRKKLREGKPSIIPQKIIVRLGPGSDNGEASGEVIVETQDRVSGRLFSKVYSTMNHSGATVIGFEFGSEGARRLRHLTREENLGRLLAVVLDGTVIYTALVLHTVGDRGVIDCKLSPSEVAGLIAVLKSGPLPVRLVLESESVIKDNEPK